MESPLSNSTMNLSRPSQFPCLLLPFSWPQRQAASTLQWVRRPALEPGSVTCKLCDFRGLFHLTGFSFLTYKSRARLNNHSGFFPKPIKASYIHRRKMKKKKIKKKWAENTCRYMLINNLFHKPNSEGFI